MGGSNSKSDYKSGVISGFLIAGGLALFIRVAHELTTWLRTTDLAQWWTRPMYSPADIFTGLIPLVIIALLLVSIVGMMQY